MAAMPNCKDCTHRTPTCHGPECPNGWAEYEAEYLAEAEKRGKQIYKGRVTAGSIAYSERIARERLRKPPAGRRSEV